MTVVLRRAAVVAVLLITLFVDAARAVDFAFVDNDDATLRTQVENLKRGTEGLEGAMDADEVVLARTLALECGRFEASRTENRMVLVRRATAAGPKRVEISVDPSHLVRVQGWVLRTDGRVERTARIGGEDSTRPVASPDPVVLDFGELGVGDAWGWTATSAFPFGVDHRLETLAGTRPILRTRIHVKSGAEVSYWAEPVRADAYDVDVRILDRQDGRPRWVQVDASNLPAVREAIFAEPVALRRPQLRVTRRGRYYPTFGMWMLRNDWDLWAATEVGSPTRWLEGSDPIYRLALDVATRGGSSRERIDLLYEWVEENVRLVRDEVPGPLFQSDDRVLDLDVFRLADQLEDRRGPESMSGWRQPFEWSSNEITGDPKLGRGLREEPVRPVMEVIESGEGTPIERTVVFASLVQATQTDVVIGFVRDGRLGPLDFEAAGRWQFTDMVVAPLTPSFVVDRWYCPTRSGLEPGELDDGLYDNSVVFVDPSIDERLAALWERIWLDRGRAPDKVIPAYVDHVRAQRLTRILPTPSPPVRPPERVIEVVRFGPDGARGRVEGGGGPDYWTRRYPDAEASVDADAPLPATLRAELELPAAPDAWTIPGQVLFGHGPFDAWEGLPRPAFHVDRARTHRWSVELPVPAGWKGAVGFEPIALQHEAFDYDARCIPGDRSIVIERVLELRAGTWSGPALAEIDERVRAILDFERGDVVLRPASKSR